jgi:hypothetical protein
MSEQIALVFAALCAALGLFIAYRRGKLRRTVVLALLLFIVPLLVIYFRR